MSENPPILLEPQTEGEETSQARSILEVLTPGMREKVEAIPDSLRSLPLDQLEQKANPSISQRRTKLKFWQEYQVVIEQNLHHLSPTKVFDGICSRQYFYRYVLDDPKVLAWFMVPAQKFDLVAEEALDFGIERLRSEILRAPLYNDAGKFDTAVANTLLQTVKFLDSRVHGSPLQRIENKNMNLHVHRTDGSVTREDLQRELEQIRLKLDGKGTTLALNAPEDPE